MLTRLYVDNFRCFVNFEYKPGRRSLILGENGSGKSSLLEVLSFLHRFAVRGESVSEMSLLGRTRWMHKAEQTFELQATIGERAYTYRLVIAFEEEHPKIRSEALEADGQPLVEVGEGTVHIYDSVHGGGYLGDRYRSALPTLADIYPAVSIFKQWIRGLVGFRINPFGIAPVAESEQLNPAFDLSNFAAWHFILAKGNTVIIDEPDNFISLREIQPWLMAASDLLDAGTGQLILISHHPELINQWAPEYGVQFVRDGSGPVRVEPFHGDSESPLAPAELVARGWNE